MHFITMYHLIYSSFLSGMGPLPWTINAEIYPLWARSTGNGIGATVCWVCNLIISVTFLSLTEAINSYGKLMNFSFYVAQST